MGAKNQQQYLIIATPSFTFAGLDLGSLYKEGFLLTTIVGQRMASCDYLDNHPS